SFNGHATTSTTTPSLHDALPILTQSGGSSVPNPAALAIDGNGATFSETPNAPDSFWEVELSRTMRLTRIELDPPSNAANNLVLRDRKSTRLNSSHLVISYAVFCL